MGDLTSAKRLEKHSVGSALRWEADLVRRVCDEEVLVVPRDVQLLAGKGIQIPMARGRST